MRVSICTILHLYIACQFVEKLYFLVFWHHLVFHLSATTGSISLYNAILHISETRPLIDRFIIAMTDDDDYYDWIDACSGCIVVSLYRRLVRFVSYCGSFIFRLFSRVLLPV